MISQFALTHPLAAFVHSDNFPCEGNQVLEAYGRFVAACDAVKVGGAFAPLLRTLGWERFEPEASEPMARIVSYLVSERWQIEKDGEALAKDPVTFRRNISGGQLKFMVQEVAVEGGLIIGCRGWNFNPDRAPSLEELVELKAEQPSRKMSSPDLLMAEWSESEDGVVLGSQIHFIPPDSRNAKTIGASGLSFKMSFVRISGQ